MEFRILGPLEVWHEGRRVRIGGAKERSVLAFLLLHANEPVSADRLVDELWGAQPPATARKSLQVRVAGLRRMLGDETLLTSDAGYLVRLAADQLDLHRFEHLVAAAERALEGDVRAAAAGLREALSLWRGPPLADFTYESFAQPAIARLDELHLAAVELQINAELALGHHDRLVPELHDLVAAHPLRERLHAQLMLALYRSGRQADALDVYRHTRERLVTELGIEPGPTLRELQQAVLRQEPSLDPQVTAPERSILVAAQDTRGLDALLDLGASLASRPARELIVALLTPEGADVPAAAALVDQRRQALLARGVAARSVAFTSAAAGEDLVRLALAQDIDLVLVDGDRDHAALLARAPCDVAVHFARDEPAPEGPVLVLFAGGDHDWTAVEVGAWIAGAQGSSLRLAAPAQGRERDASRALASASLAVQRVFGIPAEPLLLPPTEDDVLAAAAKTALVVVGLPERWSTDGLGRVRKALVERARPPALLVRRGLRPGGLAPRESLTRFTWTLGSGH